MEISETDQSPENKKTLSELNTTREFKLARIMKDGVEAKKLLDRKGKLSKIQEGHIALKVTIAREARRELIESNLKLVYSMADRYPSGTVFSRDDLIGEGTIGLINAVDRFSTDFGVPLHVYAKIFIRKSLQEAMRRRNTIKFGERMIVAIMRYKETVKNLFEKLKRRPSTEEIAENMGIDVKRVAKIEAASRDIVSLDVQERVGDQTYKSREPQSHGLTPAEEVEKNSTSEALWDILENLPKTELDVIEMFFGLRDEEPKSLKEVGDALGMSKEGARQIKIKVIEKIRQSLDKI